MSDVPPAAVAAAEPEPILSYGKPCKPSVHRRWKGAATRQLLELTAIKNWHCIACGNLNTNNARTCKNQECACPRNSADLVQWGMAHPDHAGQFRRPRVYAEPPKEMEAPRNELLANILNAIKNGSTHNGNVKVFARRPARPSSMENGYQSIELDNSFALQHLGKICPAGTQLNKLADEKGVAFVNVNAHKGDIHVDILPGELHVLRGEKVVYLAPNTKRFKLGLIQEKRRSTHFKIDKNYRGDPFANWLKVTVKEGMALVIPSNVLHFVESIPNSVGVSIKVTNCLAEEDLQKNLLHFLLIEMIDLTREDDEEEAVESPNDNKEATIEQEAVLEDPIAQTLMELKQVKQEMADLRVIYDRLTTRLEAQREAKAGRDINRLPTAVSDDSNKNDGPPPSVQQEVVPQQDLVPIRNGVPVATRNGDLDREVRNADGSSGKGPKGSLSAGSQAIPQKSVTNADDSIGKGPKGNLSAGLQAENKDDNPLKPAAVPPKAANLRRTNNNPPGGSNTNNNPPGGSNTGTGEPAAKKQGGGTGAGDNSNDSNLPGRSRAPAKRKSPVGTSTAPKKKGRPPKKKGRPPKPGTDGPKKTRKRVYSEAQKEDRRQKRKAKIEAERQQKAAEQQKAFEALVEQKAREMADEDLRQQQRSMIQAPEASRDMVPRVNQGSNSNAAAPTLAPAPPFGEVVMPPLAVPQPPVAAAPNEEDDEGFFYSMKFHGV